MRFASMTIGVVAFALAGCSEDGASSHNVEGEAISDNTNAKTSGSEAGEQRLLILDEEVNGTRVNVPEGSGNATFDPDCIIAENSVAGVAVPSTLGDFVGAFPAGTVLSFEPNFMVDFGALCARSGGEDAICTMFESYDVEGYRPDIEAQGLAVYSDRCRTGEGVGPGTSITDAVRGYGNASFAFNYDNEGREYVSFADAPKAYSFRAESETGEAMQGDGLRPPGRHGGNYAGVQGEGYFETGVTQPDARIWEIWISTVP